MQDEDSPEQTQKTDEELAQERMSQWVKSDDTAPAAEGGGAAAEGEAEEAQADQTEAEEETDVDEEEAAEEVRCCRRCSWSLHLQATPAGCLGSAVACCFCLV